MKCVLTNQTAPQTINTAKHDRAQKLSLVCFAAVCCGWQNGNINRIYYNNDGMCEAVVAVCHPINMSCPC